VTYRELYDAAVRAVAEGGAESNTEDYEERAQYLLATFCFECAGLDALWCAANGTSSKGAPETVCVSLDSPFGLSDAFAPAAIYYLAAMLVLDENEEMSESFLARYSDQLATLRASLPMGKERIRDHYPDLA
jgi:hypothetical protein